MIVTALKELARAKTRLAIAEHSRRELACAMALDVVYAAELASSVAAVVVVTKDEEVRRLLACSEVHVVDDEPRGGLNAALTRGLLWVENTYPRHPVAVLPADLPTMSSTDLDRALKLCGTRHISVVPDADGTGTALLTQPAGAVVTPRFGLRSFAAHTASGARPILHADLARMRRDVDTLEHLREVLPFLQGRHTRAWLDQLRTRRSDNLDMPEILREYSSW